MLIERGRHPRFAIGESSTPLANLLLEELADRYDLPQVRAFSKWGTWQRHRPDVACGLKRGFTFLFHQPAQRVRRRRAITQRQLLVAASPHDDDRRHALVPAGFRSGAGRGGASARARSTSTRRGSSGVVTSGDGAILEGARDGRAGRRQRAVRHRRQRPARISASRARLGESPLSLAAADAGALHALRRRRAVGSPVSPASSVRRIRSMTPRCITSSRADGSGCSASTTASRAPARR